MENSNKVNISLESSLDIKSSDMLVNVETPQFAHNRQRFQGHVLPSSLRYEHDGWAAGWDVYEFTFKEFAVFSPNKEAPRFRMLRYKFNDNPGYILVIQQFVTGIEYTEDNINNPDNWYDYTTVHFNSLTILQSIFGDDYEFDDSCISTIDTGDTVKLHGKFDGKVFDINIKCINKINSVKDIYNNTKYIGSNEYVSLSEDTSYDNYGNWSISHVILSSGATKIIIEDKDQLIKLFSDDITLPSDILCTGHNSTSYAKYPYTIATFKSFIDNICNYSNGNDIFKLSGNKLYKNDSSTAIATLNNDDTFTFSDNAYMSLDTNLSVADELSAVENWKIDTPTVDTIASDEGINTNNNVNKYNISNIDFGGNTISCNITLPFQQSIRRSHYSNMTTGPYDGANRTIDVDHTIFSWNAIGASIKVKFSYKYIINATSVNLSNWIDTCKNNISVQLIDHSYNNENITNATITNGNAYGLSIDNKSDPFICSHTFDLSRGPIINPKYAYRVEGDEEYNYVSVYKFNGVRDSNEWTEIPVFVYRSSSTAAWSFDYPRNINSIFVNSSKFDECCRVMFPGRSPHVKSYLYKYQLKSDKTYDIYGAISAISLEPDLSSLTPAEEITASSPAWLYALSRAKWLVNYNRYANGENDSSDLEDLFQKNTVSSSDIIPGQATYTSVRATVYKFDLLCSVIGYIDPNNSSSIKLYFNNVNEGYIPTDLLYYPVGLNIAEDGSAVTTIDNYGYREFSPYEPAINSDTSLSFHSNSGGLISNSDALKKAGYFTFGYRRGDYRITATSDIYEKVNISSKSSDWFDVNHIAGVGNAPGALRYFYDSKPFRSVSNTFFAEFTIGSLPDAGNLYTTNVSSFNDKKYRYFFLGTIPNFAGTNNSYTFTYGLNGSFSEGYTSPGSCVKTDWIAKSGYYYRTYWFNVATAINIKIDKIASLDIAAMSASLSSTNTAISRMYSIEKALISLDKNANAYTVKVNIVSARKEGTYVYLSMNDSPSIYSNEYKYTIQQSYGSGTPGNYNLQLSFSGTPVYTYNYILNRCTANLTRSDSTLLYPHNFLNEAFTVLQSTLKLIQDSNDMYTIIVKLCTDISSNSYTDIARFTLNPATGGITASYDIQNKTVTYYDDQYVLYGSTIDDNATLSSLHSFSCAFYTILFYHCILKRLSAPVTCMLLGNTNTLLPAKLEYGILYYDNGAVKFKINTVTGRIEYGTNYNKQAVGVIETIASNRVQFKKITIDLEYYKELVIFAIFRGIFRQSKPNLLTVDTFDRNSILFKSYDGKNSYDYAFDITYDTGILNQLKNTTIDYKYTDIRDADMQKHTIKTIAADEQYQFIKQQWETDNVVENFWWLDANHILCVDKHKFTVKYKDENSPIDPWNGDTWNIDTIDGHNYVFNRDDILSDSVASYGVTCVGSNDTHALFYIVSATSDYSISIDFYDLLDSDKCKYDYTEDKLIFKKITWINLAVRHVSLGQSLCSIDSTLNMYKQLSAVTIADDSTYSATVIDDKVIFGIHYDNNMCQWTCISDTVGTTGTCSIIQGYGYVGTDGSLTGGEIPVEFYNTDYASGLGLSEAVKSLESLKSAYDINPDDTEKYGIVDNVSELYKINTGVYGTDTQQWYIAENISGIVSHILYNKATRLFSIEVLPLNNNISSIYASPSFYTRDITSYVPFIKSFRELVPSFGGSSIENFVEASLKVFLALGGNPKLYGINPKINTSGYLQQTLGQYAYVHYNSNNLHKGDVEDVDMSSNSSVNKEYVTPEDADDFSFGLRIIKQSASADTDALNNIFIQMLMNTCVNALNITIDTVKINATQNQSSVSDKGRKFSQIFLKNAELVNSTDNTIKGITPTMTSAVAGLYTLDMFYSTSDTQNICAGPGYVNHNFVSQCIAQSSTSNHFELIQVDMLLLFKALSLLEIQLKEKGMQALKDLALKNADYTSNLTVTALGSGTNAAGIAAGIALAVLAFITDALLQGLKVIEELLPTLIDAIGGDKAKVEVSAQQSKNVPTIEGKHRYGEKHEHFMWPCFGHNCIQYIKDEGVEATIENKPWKLKQVKNSIFGRDFINDSYTLDDKVIDFVTNTTDDSARLNWDGDVPYYIASCRGKSEIKPLPEYMSYVIGSKSFLPTTSFKNENVGLDYPSFTTPPIHDYMINDTWKLSMTATDSMTLWISCDDTKLFEGNFSNMIITDNFCGVACPYTAIEIKRGMQKKYIRPFAITPQALALNNNGFNCCYENKAYHAFDGYGYRIISWEGAPGMNKEYQALQYSFIINNRFKRSNKLPPNEFLGNFKSLPDMALKSKGEDRIYNNVTIPSLEVGLDVGTVGEDKDVRRYAVPVFSEFVNTLPAVVKTISPYVLTVVDGITSLTADNRNLQSAYKSPESVDFAIGKSIYRYTSEYICMVSNEDGVEVVTELVPCLGLSYLGATPYEAYFYSQDTRQYYTYAGGTSLSIIDMVERFRNIVSGRYDFVNQEVVLPCLATFVRLDKKVLDDENETDNIIIPRLSNGRFIGEVCPPTETIFNTASWFKTISLASGITFQGPNRCIINRFVVSDYMIEQIKSNYGKWIRVPREEYHPFRQYKAKYEDVGSFIGAKVGVNGWTHNPFLLVTSPLGISEDIDCMFEWDITFAWPVEMDKLYDQDNYAVVNIWAETMTPGGKVIPERPTHVYLTKELFTRTGNYGYYSFRYQSKCGAGNRERLHIWSDQYIAISGLQLEYKVMTSKRNEILTQQIDVQNMNEI